MPNQTDAKAAAPNADTLDDHGFTKVRSKGSPGRKKQTKGAKQEPIAAENPFGVFSDEDEDASGRNTMEVESIPTVTPAKTKKKVRKRKMVRKSKAQMKAALQAKATGQGNR